MLHSFTGLNSYHDGKWRKSTAILWDWKQEESPTWFLSEQRSLIIYSMSQMINAMGYNLSQKPKRTCWYNCLGLI